MCVCVVVCRYIEGDQSLQEEFVMLLDRLCQPGVLARSAHDDRVILM